MKIFTLLFFFLISGLTVYGQAADSFIIRNVDLFNGTDFTYGVDVEVAGGKITRIGVEINSELLEINGQGHTLLPGLVNAHVHAWLPYHLKNAVQFGVYTLHDMHSMNETAAELREKGKEIGYASFYSAGYAATVVGGHGTQFGYPVPVISQNLNCYEFVDQQIAAGADFIKIIYETQTSTLLPEQVDSLIERTHFYGKKAVVHISNADDALLVIRMKADALVHLWRDRPMSTKELKEVADSEIFIIPTLSVMTRSIAYAKEKGSKRSFMSRTELLEEVKKTYMAGVSLLTGTDPPNFGLDYGASLHEELSLMAEAGISVNEVLRMATSVPYQSYGNDFQLLKEGNDASFFLVKGQVHKDIKATKNITHRWMKGQLIESIEK